VFVKRFRHSPSPRGQIWLLQGGPGGDGGSMEFLVPTFFEIAPDLEVYLPDHRGTGQSTRLTCPQEHYLSLGGGTIVPDEGAECAAAVEADIPGALDHFTTTAAAEDLGTLIEWTRDPGREAYVWGVSYGTYWALRYLQVRPSQADGVVLDSVVRAGMSFTDYDVNLDETAKRIFDACGEDAFCSERLGPDPWARMGALSDKLAQGHCPTTLGLDAPAYKGLFATLMVLPFELRTMLPAFAYRIDRCNPDDEAAIVHFSGFADALSQHDYGYSRVIRNHIGLSELYETPPPSYDELMTRLDATNVATGHTPQERLMYDVWPRYPHDEHWNGYPSTSVPVLMLNGTLDAQTVIWEAEQVIPHFTAPHQTFVAIPRATHGVIVDSPLAQGGDLHCGAILTRQFLADPTSEIDQSCSSQVAPLDFQGMTKWSKYLFGTADAWGDATPATPAPSSLSTEAIDKLDDKIRMKSRWLR